MQEEQSEYYVRMAFARMGWEASKTTAESSTTPKVEDKR